jgi:hypothetical protein
MKRNSLVLALTVGFVVEPSLALAQCQTGMVQSGSSCIDRCEASLWKVTNPACVRIIKQGVKLLPWCLRGATQVGLEGHDYTDAQCQFNGSGCKNIFALSIPVVIPALNINYFMLPRRAAMPVSVFPATPSGRRRPLARPTRGRRTIPPTSAT